MITNLTHLRAYFVEMETNESSRFEVALSSEYDDREF